MMHLTFSNLTKKCTKNLCSFRHTKVPKVDLIEENIDDYNESEENNIEVESCESCGEMFDDIEDLIDHYGTTGHLK